MTPPSPTSKPTTLLTDEQSMPLTNIFYQFFFCLRKTFLYKLISCLSPSAKEAHDYILEELLTSEYSNGNVRALQFDS